MTSYTKDNLEKAKEYLRNCIEEKHLTDFSKLAKYIGVPLSNVMEWEKGVYPNRFSDVICEGVSQKFQ